MIAEAIYKSKKSQHITVENNFTVLYYCDAYCIDLLALILRGNLFRVAILIIHMLLPFSLLASSLKNKKMKHLCQFQLVCVYVLGTQNL